MRKKFKEIMERIYVTIISSAMFTLLISLLGACSTLFLQYIIYKKPLTIDYRYLMPTIFFKIYWFILLFSLLNEFLYITHTLSILNSKVIKWIKTKKPIRSRFSVSSVSRAGDSLISEIKRLGGAEICGLQGKNSGTCNSGTCNSGTCNSGTWNSGNCNSGNWNSGCCNSGNLNSGDRNSGNWNSGCCNSGNWNSGDWNSGNRNSGICNSGDRNSGDKNSGNWNSGDRNSGFLNTNEPKVRIFNKETNIHRQDIKFPNYFYFELNKWISVSDMTYEEKEKYYWHKTTGGCLRKIEYKEAWKLSFEKATKKDVRKTLDLPNFDYNIFEEITGITKEMMKNKLDDLEHQ